MVEKLTIISNNLHLFIQDQQEIKKQDKKAMQKSLLLENLMQNIESKQQNWDTNLADIKNAFSITIDE